MRTVDTGGVWPVAGAIVLALAVAVSSPRGLLAQAATQGQWRTLANQSPINPIHVALMNNGDVLIVAGSGNVATETNFQAAVWDSGSETFLTRALAWDMFCNGMVVLHDGRVLVNGGNLQYDPFHGEPRNAVFDPATGLFTDVQNMAHGRWYPTVTTLGDGRVMTFSGLTETGGTNTAVEIYTVGSGWSPEYPAGWTPPLYPRMHLSTDGRVFYAGSGRGSRFFSPSTNTWSAVVATTNYTSSRSYGTSVLLPLTPANGYRPRVMIFGGGSPSTATTEIIDLSAPTPAWQFGPSMSQARIQMSATILPNGKVLAVGGSRNDEDALTASLNADLYDPATNTFSPASANLFARLYHSASLLLPDATVLLVGGNPQRGNYQRSLRELLARVPVQQQWHRRVPSHHHGRARHGGLRRHVPGSDAGRGRDRLGRPGTAGCGDARVRHGTAAGRRVLHDWNRRAERDGAAQRQHRPARLLHAVRAECRRRAVGRQVRASDLARQSGSCGHDYQSGVECHAQPGRRRVLRGNRHRSRRNHQRLCLDVSWRQSCFELGGESRERHLHHARHLRGDAQGDGQWRPREPGRDADHHDRGFLPDGHSVIANDTARSEHELHRHGGARERVHRDRGVQRDRSSLRRNGDIQPGIRHDIRIDDDERVDERGDSRRAAIP